MTTLPELRAAVRARLGDWGYEVVRCESGDFAPDVVYGPRTGAAGELGLGQLHPRGKLPAFYAAGYSDPFDPEQQIDFLEVALFDDPGAWSCAH